MMNYIMKDTATAKCSVIRFSMSVAPIMDFKLRLVGIKGAYLQSGPIKRDICTPFKGTEGYSKGLHMEAH